MYDKFLRTIVKNDKLQLLQHDCNIHVTIYFFPWKDIFWLFL